MVTRKDSLYSHWSYFDVPVETRPTRLAQVSRKVNFFISLVNLSNIIILFYGQDENVTINNELPLLPQSTVDLCISQDLYGVVESAVAMWELKNWLTTPPRCPKK